MGSSPRAAATPRTSRGPVTDRALFHADNAYFYPHVRLESHPMKTNTVSNTAFRGFGGPQGVIAAERMVEEIAYALGKDHFGHTQGEFLWRGRRDVTPYHQTVEDNIMPRIVEELEASADYQARREAVLAHNAKGGIIRRGIALTPVKFGISFTATWYNQAGALVHVYNDGSIHLNHGGTEMGQGLNTKVAQVVAETFQVDVDRIKITRTTTEKVPNTSATAASSGSDLNGMAALDAAEQIKARLIDFAAERWQANPRRSSFAPTACRSAMRSSASMPSSRRPTWPASTCRRRGSTRRPRSIGTAPPARAARSITTPMAPPVRKSRSTR